MQEQDPVSQWYREDLYHGEPGPDVRADYERTREEERLGDARSRPGPCGSGPLKSVRSTGRSGMR